MWPIYLLCSQSIGDEHTNIAATQDIFYMHQHFFSCHPPTQCGSENDREDFTKNINMNIFVCCWYLPKRQRHFGWKLNLSPLYFQATNCPEMRFCHEKDEKMK